MVFSVLILSFLILTPTLSLSAEVKMKWDANKPTPAGYRIYQRIHGQTYNYKNPVWTGSKTTATIDKLKDSAQYYFVVRAFKGAIESADSNEIAFKSGSPLPPATKTAAKPTMTPDGGKFSGSVKVSLKTTTPGAKIYYTTNGKTPSKSSTRYTKPFTLKKNTTVKALAVAAGYQNSPMASATFTKSGASTKTAAKPKMTPNGGKFSGSVKVSLKTTTPGAKIYYTTNGKTPSKSSTRYTKPFTLKKTTTVKAFAVASGYKNSPMASATFTKSGASTKTAAKPKLTPNGGKFSGSVKVSLKTTTSGAKIYYTTNGKTPSTKSTRYRKPFTLKKNTTVKAFAVASGYKNSAMASVKFTRTSSGLMAVDLLTPTAMVQQPYSGKPWPIPGTIEAEDYDTGGEAVAYHDTTEGNRGGKYRKDDVDIWYASDRYSGHYTGNNATGEWLEYTVKVAAGGMYSLDLNVATPESNRKMHVTLDGKDITGPIRLPNTGGWNEWETVMNTVQLQAGEHVLRVIFDRGGLNFNWIDIYPIGSEEDD